MKLAIRMANVFLALLLSGVLGLPLSAAPRARHRARRSLASLYPGVPTFADSTKDDVVEFDDPVVRQAAVEALGRYNGAVVATDPNTGRILTVVNQKLAFSGGFIPCSTIKPTIALAALKENIINGDTLIKVSRRRSMNLTQAMAHSNNKFFEELGRRMGFATVSRYGRLLGLGELAGYGLPEEQPGSFPMAPPENGGVARMSSFGEGIQVTPFQLAALTSAFANGGTMYYLQYPRTAEERDQFAPRIKRKLAIEPMLPELREAMLATVLYGTGRGSFDSDGDAQALGKTGTCSDHIAGARIGWFTSYNDEAHPKISLVVFLRGNTRKTKGPTAAAVAGRIYRTLREKNYFAEKLTRTVPANASLISSRAGR